MGFKKSKIIYSIRSDQLISYLLPYFQRSFVTEFSKLSKFNYTIIKKNKNILKKILNQLNIFSCASLNSLDGINGKQELCNTFEENQDLFQVTSERKLYLLNLEMSLSKYFSLKIKINQVDNNQAFIGFIDYVQSLKKNLQEVSDSTNNTIFKEFSILFFMYRNKMPDDQNMYNGVNVGGGIDWECDYFKVNDIIEVKKIDSRVELQNNAQLIAWAKLNQDANYRFCIYNQWSNQKYTIYDVRTW